MSTPMNIQHHRRSSMSFYAPQPTHARSFSNQLGTSWSDGFEFDSCSPLTSALHFGTSPSANNAYMTSSCAPFFIPSSPPRDYFTFERDYCSNFACCGITLPDMHALVAHFEESHLGGADGMPFMAHHQSLGPGVGISSQPKPAPQIVTNAESGMNVSPNTAVGDVPSPHSSVGPETPPPVSHVAGYPHLQVQTQVYGCRSNSASPYPNSPYSSSGSSGNSEGSGSQSSSSIGEMDVDVDILMSFDPLDSAVHTPLDSTPPSPLAHPIRPNSVLRSAVLKNNGGQPDAPPVCLPPALFSAPPPGPSPLGLDKDGSSLKKEKREKREKEKRSRPENLTVATSEASGSSGNAGGAVRREKCRKAASSAMGSLLGLGAASLCSSMSSSSDEDSASGENTKAEKAQEKKLEEKSEKPHRERAERTGRPERPDKSGKRTREKAYKCPKPGCTKSYLNPNGLKYHTLKGTCTFLNGSGPPTPVTPTTPSIPSITVPSAPPVATLSPSSSQHASDASSLSTASQPLTPISMPSSPIVNGTHQMYEYANRHQVQILPEIAPREGVPQAYMYAPAQMC